MDIRFRPTKEFVIENDILIIDPHYLMDENLSKLIINTYYDENELLTQSGILSLDGKELFIFPGEYGDSNYEIKLYDEYAGEITTDSGVIALIKKDIATKINRDIESGIVLNIEEKEVIKYKGNGKLSGPISFVDEEEEDWKEWMDEGDIDEY